MVVGESGLGKSTFVNTLFSTHLVDSHGNPKPLEAEEQGRNQTEIYTKSFGTPQHFES
jgi:septin family protein